MIVWISTSNLVDLPRCVRCNFHVVFLNATSHTRSPIPIGPRNAIKRKGSATRISAADDWQCSMRWLTRSISSSENAACRLPPAGGAAAHTRDQLSRSKGLAGNRRPPQPCNLVARRGQGRQIRIGVAIPCRRRFRHNATPSIAQHEVQYDAVIRLAGGQPSPRDRVPASTPRPVRSTFADHVG